MKVRKVYGKGPDGELVVKYLELITVTQKQKFSERLVTRGLREGWLEMGAGRLTLKGKPPLTFKIVSYPGYYCCHDEKYFEDGAEAQAYTETLYASIPSPDKQNPSGYRRDAHYMCELATTKASQRRASSG